MKQIGILTYHHHENYGTMLQAFALQEALRRMGHDAQIIDFFQPVAPVGEELQQLHRQRILHYLTHPRTYAGKARDAAIRKLMRPHLAQKSAQFERFYRENFRLSPRHYGSTAQLEAQPPEYDVYLVGSDQTWNPLVGGNPDAFYLTFAPERAIRASYAPSVSISSLSHDQAQRMKKLLEHVDYLSCREQEGAELLRSLTGRPVAAVLDPTFLLDGGAWDAFAQETEHPPKYLLQYLIGRVPAHRSYIRAFARRLGLPIVSIPCTPADMLDPHTQKQWVGPGGFLSLIRDAQVVCTDSFHGTAFSLNYGTPVFSFCKTADSAKSSENSRLHSIYRQFGLSSRLITDLTRSPAELSMDSAVLEENKKRLVEHSLRYLTSFLDA